MQDENDKSDEQIEWEEIVYNDQKEHDKELVKKEPIEKFFWAKLLVFGIGLTLMFFFAVVLIFLWPFRNSNIDF